MRETMQGYLQRRYRLALVGVVIGAVLLISHHAVRSGSAWISPGRSSLAAHF
jgi:hypothetical protein